MSTFALAILSVLIRFVLLITTIEGLQGGWTSSPPNGRCHPRHRPSMVLVPLSGTSTTTTTTGSSSTTPTRQDFLTTTGQTVLGSLFLLATDIPAAIAAEDDHVDWTTAPPLTSIPPCPRTAAKGASNYVSTASVLQVDLYQPPWTFTTTPEEALARLKGIVATDPKATIVGSTEQSLAVVAQRNLGSDRIDFVINPTDKVIFFTSRRIDDETGSDFGANRQRLERWRMQSQGLFGVMGQTNDDAFFAQPPREGGLGQLKAFYGLQSGAGFQDLLLDDD